MQKTILILLFLSVCSVSIAQQTIKPEEATKHIGDSVIICGKIYGGIFLESVTNKPTFLNMGAVYPNQLVTIVIWGNIRKQFSYKPEEKLKNKMVCISGKVEVFKGKPQIVITKAAQLKEE